MKRPQRVLCVCQGGNCRSVHLAYLLKYRYGVDALAIGFERNERETLDLLCTWADVIIVVQDEYKEVIASRFIEKTYVMDVGEDKWFSPNTELLDLFDKKIKARVRSIDGSRVQSQHDIERALMTH